MRFPSLVSGRFVRRVNRFRVSVRTGEELVDAHLANSGRLSELLTPGRPCWLEPAAKPHRKTDYDLKLVAYEGVLVSVDARLPNPLFAEALSEARLVPFQGCLGFEREVALDDSRIDFRLQMADGAFWVETKSVTLVEGGIALFPDAPTLRGRRHLAALVEAVRAGSQSAVVFIVQRSDARAFRPNAAADPRFAETLRRAADENLEVRAWTCSVSTEQITVTERIPVLLS